MGSKRFFTQARIPDDNPNVAVKTGGYRPSQPSQRFPFTPNQPPRVDNANQPWYGRNDRGFGVGPDTIQDQTAQDLTGAKLTGFWETLNNFFGGNTAKANLQSRPTKHDQLSQVVNPSSVGAQNQGFWGQYQRGWGNLYE